MSWLAACQQNGFVRVTVGEAAGAVEADGGDELPTIYQIRSTATDNTSTTPSVELGPKVANGITFPETFVVEVPSNATSLTELVEGLDESGNTLLRGSSVATLAKGGQAAMQVNLSPACGTSLDCDPEAVCAGELICSPAGGAGACIANPETTPPGFGTPCGYDGGRCDAELSCVAPFGTCGDGVQGSDPEPDGGVYVEQCDWGTETEDGGACTGPDGGCNSDTEPNACRTDCVLPYCGDGVVDMGEKCDKGELNGSEQGCNATCSLVGKATRIAGNGDITDAGHTCIVSCYVDGPGSQAQFEQVAGIAVLGRTLYVADELNEVIRAIDLSSAPAYNVTTLAGDAGPVAGGGACATTQEGVGNNACFYLPFQPMAYQGTLLVGTGMDIQQVTVGPDGGGVVTNFAGPGTGATKAESSNTVPLSQAAFDYVTGLTLDPATGFIYTVEQQGGFIHVIDVDGGLDAGTVAYLAGATRLASFAGPTSGVVMNGGLFITNTGNFNIDRISPLPGAAGQPAVAHVAGSGSAGFTNSSAPGGATFNAPAGMCTDGKTIYIVDQTNRAVRQMDPVNYQVTTVLGGPDAGIFDNPYGCAWDPVAGVLYVSDESNPAATPDGVGNVIYMVQ
jgi:hypothetical protein